MIKLFSIRIPKIPLLVWLLIATVAMGFLAGMSSSAVIEKVASGFGKSLGFYLLILFPSLLLASSINMQNAGGNENLIVGLSPIAGAGMVCASTAYAALSPISGNRRLEVALGAHAGFKLLYPAAPLIIATGLGFQVSSLFLYGFVLLIPVWAIGVLWARAYGEKAIPLREKNMPNSHNHDWVVFWPFIILASLLSYGSLISEINSELLQFLTQPIGALALSATLAMFFVRAEERTVCFENALQRTGSLLLGIGIASASGSMLVSIFPVASYVSQSSGGSGIVSLFLIAAIFKLIQGSSLATFAAVTPIAIPILEISSIHPAAAVLAICMGTFVAILPNDSFYWITRRDALPHSTELAAAIILAGGSTLQGLVGLAVLLAGVELGLFVI